MQRRSNSSSGFTLVEMTISAAIGLVLVSAAAKVYSTGLKISVQTSQRAEMQQDFRAAANLLQRDISMAGAGALGQQGLSTSGATLPTGTGTAPVYPCTALSTCNYINGAPVAYPNSPTGAPTLYSIIPGPGLGITVTAAAGATDIITLNYADATLPLNCYTGTMNGAGTIVTFQLPTAWASSCVLPSNLLLPPSLIYNAVGNSIGLQVGDLILFGTAAAGVVTGAAATCAPTAGYIACYTVPFSAGDPGHVNQPGAVGGGSLSQYAGVQTPSAVRLVSTTYYLAIPASTGLPTLMRIQSGQLPAPVAENVVFLKFTYDVINAGTVSVNQASLPVGTTPAMITKVNIAHMSMRSQGRDNTSRSALSSYGGFESLDLQTSIAARNLTSQQQYPITVTN